MTLAVTGATGSVGVHVVGQALAAGEKVRALVRRDEDAAAVAGWGAEPVLGDVTDAASVRRLVDGADRVVHCAAQIGGTWSTAKPEDYEAVNQLGSFHVLDAAAAAGVERTVVLLSAIVCDRDETITERFRPLPIEDHDSPYTRTKRAVLYEGLARAARGSEICFVIPGGIYGPSPLVDRALVPTIFTGTLLMAYRGELSRYLPMPITWVLGEDVARVSLAAAERGRRGRSYLALGRPEDACSLPSFCNRFLSLVDSPHRVQEFDPTGPGATDDPEFGTMVKMLRASYPEPAFDATVTNTELGIDPVGLAEGLRRTAEWLRAEGRIT